MRRDYPVRPILGVGTVIIQDGKIILVKRRAEPGRGRWSIPGGTVHVGEKVREAAVREAKEESGLDIEIIQDRPLDVFDSIMIDDRGRVQYHFALVDFLAVPKGGTLAAAEDAAEARWVSLDEVKKYDLTNSFRVFFEKHENILRAVDSKKPS